MEISIRLQKIKRWLWNNKTKNKYGKRNEKNKESRENKTQTKHEIFASSFTVGTQTMLYMSNIGALTTKARAQTEVPISITRET